MTHIRRYGLPAVLAIFLFNIYFQVIAPKDCIPLTILVTAVMAAEQTRGRSPDQVHSEALTEMTHNQRHSPLTAMLSPLLFLVIYTFIRLVDPKYFILLIAFFTFSAVVKVSMLWSARFDLTKPLAPRFGLRTMMVAVALIAVETAAWNKWLEWSQSTYLRQKYLDTSSHHGFWAHVKRGDARLNSEFSVDDPSDTARDREFKKYLRDTAKGDSEEAEYHDSLRQKYEQAAQFPLRPVAPDPPPPKRPKRPLGLEKSEPDRPID